MRCVLPTLLLGLLLSSSCGAAETPPVPEISWQPCADWINVRTDVEPRAMGDGRTDDTAALQAALDQMHGLGGGPKVIYLPPGVYRTTRTLVMPNSVGCVLVGHGRTTILRWDGPADADQSVMLWSNGSVLSRYEGIVWDGAGRARVGIHHYAHDRFENKILHQHEAFLDFIEAGVLMGPQNPFATSESELRNCWFERCGKGISLVDFNYYNEVADSCEFRDCAIGIHTTRWGQIFARNCHFERSTVADLHLGESHKHSVRRCTSVGSQQFLVGRAVTLQDCHVEDWRSPEGAIALQLGFPVVLFDCVFTRPPSPEPPIRAASPKQKLLVSNNRSPDTRALWSGTEDVVEIPAGELGGAIESARQRFFRSEVAQPGKVFDAVRDFSAEGKDATAAVQATIDAARAHGQGAIAYFPLGRYRISQTLDVQGENYTIAGAGYHSDFQWTGAPGGVLMHVHQARRVTLREFNIIGHSVPREMTGIRHTGGAGASHVTYDRVWIPDGWQSDDQQAVRGIDFVGLQADDRVHVLRLHGSGAFRDAAAAQVLVRFWDGSPILIAGEPAAQPGFLGFLNANGNQIVVRDNLDVVFGEFYCEQAEQTIVRASGDGRARHGRLTVGAARLHAWKEAEAFAEIDDYAGWFSYGHGHITRDRSAESYRIAHRGTRPLDLIFFAHSHPYFAFPADSTARLLLVQNAGLDNSLSPPGLALLSPVLDHFRELSHQDLQFRHHESPPR